MSVFFLFLLRLLWSEEAIPKARQDLNMVIPSSSGHLWKRQVSSCSHTCVSPCSAPFTERNLLGSSLLLIFLQPGLLEPSRRKCKLATWAYVLDFLLKLRRHIFPAWKWKCTGKDPDSGKDWGHEEKGATEDEIVEWHHRLNGYGFG